MEDWQVRERALSQGVRLTKDQVRKMVDQSRGGYIRDDGTVPPDVRRSLNSELSRRNAPERPRDLTEEEKAQLDPLLEAARTGIGHGRLIALDELGEFAASIKIDVNHHLPRVQVFAGTANETMRTLAVTEMIIQEITRPGGHTREDWQRLAKQVPVFYQGLSNTHPVKSWAMDFLSNPDMCWFTQTVPALLKNAQPGQRAALFDALTSFGFGERIPAIQSDVSPNRKVSFALADEITRRFRPGRELERMQHHAADTRRLLQLPPPR